ncbi:hypothetical protein H6G00_13815 [Leptolyngbya sp. FACHB-541]|uniref:hypothetical protein n=1 Tax=Leptolyngbya sp. FACHB-541 TaxID=2692810 RepID=UPI001682B60F|nr:hypothetical protein [Leptolyngbya sp. FACHB-541]MBD1997691.1 hypothetical protein [Leptolyngbya sp. FACHB-541]
MPSQPLSANLSTADQAAIEAALETIREKLPFLVTMTTEERRKMAKLGDKTRAFVQKSVEFAARHPDYLPRRFDFDAMQEDVDLFMALYPIWVALNDLQELVHNTYMLAGSEAYAAAREVYSSAKATGKGEIDSSLNEMGRRFRKSRKVQSEGENGGNLRP